jgi:hypothetical protein
MVIQSCTRKFCRADVNGHQFSKIISVNLCVLCVSVVKKLMFQEVAETRNFTTETQRTQRFTEIRLYN